MDDMPKGKGVVEVPMTAAQPDQGITSEELKASLLNDLQAALTAGDFKKVASISKDIAQMQAKADKAEIDAKLAKLDSIRVKVLTVMEKAAKVLVDSKELDEADGIWFSWDFGEAKASVRLTKAAPKAKGSSGGGAGKKFDVSTDTLLASHGHEPNGESGLSLKASYEATTDGNKRYQIRTKLLKLAGYIS